MGFASKIWRKRVARLEELASDEAGLLNERERLLLLWRGVERWRWIKYLLEGEGRQKRSGEKPRNAGRRRRKSRRRRLHQPRGVEEKEDESTWIHSVLKTMLLGLFGRVTETKEATSFVAKRTKDRIETKDHSMWARPQQRLLTLKSYSNVMHTICMIY